jgi:hypothetical protein
MLGKMELKLIEKYTGTLFKRNVRAKCNEVKSILMEQHAHRHTHTCIWKHVEHLKLTPPLI